MLKSFSRSRSGWDFSPRRFVASTVAVLLLGSGAVLGTARPAGAACGQGGEWIGSWTGTQSPSGTQYSGTWEAQLSFSSTDETGMMTFITGGDTVFSNAAVHADVSPSDCHVVTNGTLTASSGTPVTFDGVGTADGTESSGHFNDPNVNVSGTYSGGLVTNSTENPNTMTQTFPAGATAATPTDPVYVQASDPNSGPMAIGSTPIQAPTISGYALLGANGQGIVYRIVAPPGTPDNPLVITFEILGSSIPSSGATGLHNGQPIAPCSDTTLPPHVTAPNADPCVVDPNGTPVGSNNPPNRQYTVWSSNASVWAFGRATVPSAPRSPSATAGKGQAVVKWKAPAISGGPALTGYVVTPYLGKTALPARKFNNTKTTETITGLTKGKSYTFKIAAKNKIGTGPKSKATNAVTIK